MQWLNEHIIWNFCIDYFNIIFSTKKKKKQNNTLLLLCVQCVENNLY